LIPAFPRRVGTIYPVDGSKSLWEHRGPTTVTDNLNGMTFRALIGPNTDP